MAQAVRQFFSESGKPVIVTAPQAQVRCEFMKSGIPTFAYERDAISALVKYSNHMQLTVRDLDSVEENLDSIAYTGSLSEADSLALLEKYGIPVVSHIAVSTAEEARSFADKIGYPVVIKGCASEVPHKSEHGLVRLGINSGAAVTEAAEDCLKKLRKIGVENPQIIVGKQLKGEFEFLLGASIDPIFGPLVMIGEGGVLAELRSDVAILAAPFTRAEALKAIHSLRIAPVLGGFRGSLELDTEALADAAVLLGKFASSCRNSLVSVDLNPVMVMSKGKGVVAVDAVIEFKS